jgi:hypothetical protein
MESADEATRFECGKYRFCHAVDGMFFASGTIILTNEPRNRLSTGRSTNLVQGRCHTRSRLTLEAVQASTTKERDND